MFGIPSLTVNDQERYPSDSKLPTVVASADFRRVYDLPRRVLVEKAITDLTSLFQKPGGTMNLRPLQSAALLEAALNNGGLFPLSCGGGKTLLSLLLPTAMDSEKAVLLVPSQLRAQLAHEIKNVYGKHFFIPTDKIHIVSYSELSSARKAAILEDLRPDLIICDECHLLKNRTSARTKRFLRFFKDFPSTRLVCMSGTITSRSIKDYAHLLALTHKKNAPVPLQYLELRSWAGALDAKPFEKYNPGVLYRFCNGDENPRQGFRRRLIETEGIVCSAEEDIGVSLEIYAMGVELPHDISIEMNRLKKTWCIGDNELEDAVAYAAARRQLACGFYYEWVWPNGIVNRDWLEARSKWHSAVRQRLKFSTPGMDSPLLLANAAERALTNTPGKQWLEGVEVWVEWKKYKHIPPPPTRAVWISDFLLKDLIRRAKAFKEPCIIWTEHVAFAERLAVLSGFPYYGEGTDATFSREKIIIASITVQNTGKNLQYHFCHNLFSHLPASGKTFEQTISRTHRSGQEHDLVTVGWYAHTEESIAAMQSVYRDALYQRETMNPQRIFSARMVNFDFETMNRFVDEETDEEVYVEDY